MACTLGIGDPFKENIPNNPVLADFSPNKMTWSPITCKWSNLSDFTSQRKSAKKGKQSVFCQHQPRRHPFLNKSVMYLPPSWYIYHQAFSHIDSSYSSSCIPLQIIQCWWWKFWCFHEDQFHCTIHGDIPIKWFSLFFQTFSLFPNFFSFSKLFLFLQTYNFLWRQTKRLAPPLRYASGRKRWTFLFHFDFSFQSKGCASCLDMDLS